MCPPADVRAPLLAGVRALPPQMCTPPSSQACAPYPSRRVRPSRMRARPPTAVRAPLKRASPPRRRLRPTLHACAPSPPPCAPPHRRTCPSHLRARPARSRAHPAPTNVRAFIVGGEIRYIRRGPLYPHFTTLGFVSWDSFEGSLHEVVGMVQHFRF
jgi:hypothetical protein